MKISDIIEALKIIQQSKGNIECVAEDGFDPSDKYRISRIEFIPDFSEQGSDFSGPVVYIQ